MRVVALLLSFLCLLASVVLLWLGYIVTFESSSQLARFESTPKEGWDYWLRKEFWSDVRWFSLYLGLAVGGFGLPLTAFWRGRRKAQGSRLVSWGLFGIAMLYTGVWTWGFAMWWRRGDFHLMIIIPTVMLMGSVVALSAFFVQASRPRAGVGAE